MLALAYFVVLGLLAQFAHGFQGLTTKARVSQRLFMNSQDPLLLRAARGEEVERVPVWMMRQAGRHMQVYRELCKKHKTFRERSENADVATEISLQPFNRYGTDGCILFSDILTPFPGMGIDFDITEKEGPKMKTWTTMEDVDKIKLMDPHKSTPFVAEALKNLRREVGNRATVLGFVGLPYTLATYMVEGGSSTEYKQIKSLGYQNPKVLHAMLDKLAENIGDYACFQIESGAQVIQVFDSWAGNLSPHDYDTFAAPYQRKVIEKIKKKHPKVPTIMYINKSGALLERMAASGVDIVSLDWTVTIPEARKRIGDKVGIQGNLDPMVLFAPKEVIKERTEEILKATGGRHHVMNLGHGIDAHTPEENAEFFVKTVQGWKK
jgi:uroporphyrinogen decarboxylase